MDREQHLEWCKLRAMAHLNGGDPKEAMISMVSDLGKHPDTEPIRKMAFLMMMATPPGDLNAVRKFIMGFH